MAKDQKLSPIDEHFNAGHFEIVDFMKGEKGKGSWLNHTLLEATPREVLSRVLADPLWDSTRMKISIYLNSERIIHEDFEKLVSFFSDNITQQKLRRANFENFELAVQEAAKGLLARSADSMQEKFYDLQNQLSQLTDLTAEMVQREYSAPFKFQITEKMDQAGQVALARFFDTEPDVGFDGKAEESAANAADHAKRAVEAIYKAMVTARGEPSYTAKLPTAFKVGDEYSAHEIATRQKMLEEIKESLTKQGIAFE